MAPALQEDLQYFHICGACFMLDERGRPDERDQRCPCRPCDETRWPGYDFNERVALCRCCGQEALRSGSRWSPFFCRECQLLAMGVSIWEQRLVLPIGRHSLMHTFVPGVRVASPVAQIPSRDEVAANLVTGVRAVSAGGDLLRLWATTCVAHNMKTLRLRGGVRLITYLEAVEESKTLRSRLGAFTELCAFVRASAATSVSRNENSRPARANAS